MISMPKVCLPASLYKKLVTEQYMLIFGIEFTHGGSYPYKNINTNELAVLQKETTDAKKMFLLWGFKPLC